MALYKTRTEQLGYIDLPEIHEVQPTNEGWSIGKKVDILRVDIDNNVSYSDGRFFFVAAKMGLDLVENNYYRLKDKVGEEDYYQFRDSDMEPVNLADINKESEEALRKEIKRLKAELADIHKKLKIKKGDK